MNFKTIGKLVLPKNNVKKVENGIELIFKNILPKIKIRDFKISKISEYADIYIDGNKLKESDFQKISININKSKFLIKDLELLEEITIPHKPNTKVFIPLEYERGKKINLKLEVKKPTSIVIEVERKVQ